MGKWDSTFTTESGGREMVEDSGEIRFDRRKGRDICLSCLKPLILIYEDFGLRIYKCECPQELRPVGKTRAEREAFFWDRSRD
jgi:hypothetical protein